MVLKDCVDAHPEYYGKMSQPKEDTTKSASAEDKVEVIEEVEEVKEEGIEGINEEVEVEEGSFVDISQNEDVPAEELSVEVPQEEKVTQVSTETSSN